AARHGGMDEQRNLAAVEFVEHRREGRVPKWLAGIAREQPDAVELQGVERIGGLAQAAFDVRQRDGGEHPEPAGEIPRHLGAELRAEAGRRKRRDELSTRQARMMIVRSAEMVAAAMHWRSSRIRLFSLRAL